MNEVALRDVTRGDRETIFGFNRSLSERDLPKDGFDRAFDENLASGNNKYLIAEIAGKAVGMGSCHVQMLLHHAVPIAEIQEMYVEPAYRSSGVGRLLINALVDFAKSKGALQVELSTNRKRLDAHRFYAREGFVATHLKWIRHVGGENPA